MKPWRRAGSVTEGEQLLELVDDQQGVAVPRQGLGELPRQGGLGVGTGGEVADLACPVPVGAAAAAMGALSGAAGCQRPAVGAVWRRRRR